MLKRNQRKGSEMLEDQWVGRSVSLPLLALTIAAWVGWSGSANAQDFRQPGQPVEDQFLFLAKGIKAQYLSREVGQALDQIQFLPHGAQRPTHLIACIEVTVECLSGNCAEPFQVGDKLNPSVQRIDLSTGEVKTVVRGMTICDGIRTTEWGTVIATEEDFVSDTGGVYEILDPFTADEYTILSRGAGDGAAMIVDQNGNDASERIAKRTALPVIRWEGIFVHSTGVIIAGDEERPGSYREGDTDGGAIHKFIPSNPRTAAGPISSLDDSPLTEGTTRALQASCRSGSQQFGQGCEIGAGAWVELIPTATETGEDSGILRVGREAANDAGATGYYRPEDLHRDPMYSDPEHPNAVRFCFTATGDASANNYGEVQCAVDMDVTAATGTNGEVSINRFVEGDADLNQPDNLDFQPGTGILYVIEDNPNGDIWACLPDGDDRDLKTDGCVRLLTLADPSAEPTGFIFAPDGRTAVFNIQHSADDNMPLVDDFLTDDLMMLRGFRTGANVRGGDFGARTQKRLIKQSFKWFGFKASP